MCLTLRLIIGQFALMLKIENTKQSVLFYLECLGPLNRNYSYLAIVNKCLSTYTEIGHFLILVFFFFILIIIIFIFINFQIKHCNSKSGMVDLMYVLKRLLTMARY